MTGTVKKIVVNSGGNLVRLDRTDPPPPEPVDLIDVPDWALRQFQTALAGNKPVSWATDGGGTVLSVTVG